MSRTLGSMLNSTEKKSKTIKMLRTIARKSCVSFTWNSALYYYLHITWSGRFLSRSLTSINFTLLFFISILMSDVYHATESIITFKRYKQFQSS